MAVKINWSPSADLAILKRRAQLLADVRLFFAEKNVMEVDTPVLSQAAPTAPYLESFVSQYQQASGRTTPYYLQTSPEFAMKRLLAAGSGDIYQIAHVFRHGELGRHHNPEFCMLEWYRPELDYPQLMQEVDELIQSVADMPPAVRFDYHGLFTRWLQLDIDTVSIPTLKQLALVHITSLPQDWETSFDGWLELLMSEVIEPELAKLGRPVLVYDFPASQAQLAKVYHNTQGRQVAARFELYAGGLELANGYDECQDAAVLRQRFEADNQSRRQQHKPVMPMDEHLLAALDAGLPACTGVALGLDRLLMLITGSTRIEQVQSFHFLQS